MTTSTFKSFLLNEAKKKSSRLEGGDALEVADYAIDYCSNHLKVLRQIIELEGEINYDLAFHVPIIRSSDASIKYGVGDSTQGTRSSRNTNNLYTLIIDNHPSWSKYPKRSKSFICGNGQNYHHVSGYGDSVFIVIPENNTTIGACRGDDIWESFPKALNFFKRLTTTEATYIDDVNNVINRFISVFCFGDHRRMSIGNQATYSSLLKLIQKTDKEMKNYIEGKDISFPDEVNKFADEWQDYYYGNTLKESITYIMGTYGSFENCIFEIYNPVKNGFELANEKNIKEFNRKPQELWFAGRAVFVNQNNFKQFWTYIDKNFKS